MQSVKDRGRVDQHTKFASAATSQLASAATTAALRATDSFSHNSCWGQSPQERKAVDAVTHHIQRPNVDEGQGAQGCLVMHRAAACNAHRVLAIKGRPAGLAQQGSGSE